MSRSSSAPTVTPATVAHIAQLANIEISSAQQQSFSMAFTETLAEIDTMLAVDTTGIDPTHQVTGLKNHWREDQVDSNRQLTQEQALSGASHTFAGMIVVDRVLEGDTA